MSDAPLLMVAAFIMIGATWIALAILDVGKKLCKRMEILTNKRATPAYWATELEEYFLLRKNDEGVMLSQAISKILARKKGTDE